MDAARSVLWPKFTRFRGDTKRLRFTLTDDQGAIVKPDDCTLFFNVDGTNGAPLVQKQSITGGFTTIDNNAGVVEVEVLPLDDAALANDIAYACVVVAQHNTTGAISRVRATLKLVDGVLDDPAITIPQNTTGPDVAFVWGNIGLKPTALQVTPGSPLGVATLDSAGKLLTAQLPALSLVDRFIVSSEAAMLALTAQTGDVAIRTDLNRTYILGGADPTLLADWTLLLTSGGDLQIAANLSDLADAANARFNLGLGNVDNTADTAKPVSLAQQAALDLKAALASPTFTGTPLAPTALTGTRSTQLATTAFVGTEIDAAVAALLNSAPGALDTLNELATALGDDPNFATTVTNSIATKLAKASNLSDLANAATARTNLGVAIGTDVQAYSAQLAALAALGTAGLIVRTAANTIAARTLTGTAGNVTVANGDGVAGNPTLSLPTALTSINSIASAALSNLTLGTGTFGPAVTVESGSGKLFLGDSQATTSVNNGYLHLRTNGTTNPLRLGAYNNTTSSQSWLAFDRAGGTIAAPTAVTSGMVFGSIIAVGSAVAGEPVTHSAEIKLYATESWNAGAIGSAIDIITFKKGTTSSLLTARFQEGRVDVHAGATDTNAASAWLNAYSDGAPGKRAIRAVDLAAMAQGVGGKIALTGVYTTGGSPADEGATIEAYKTNGTSGNYSFDLVFGTRANGGNVTEAGRFTDQKNFSVVGNLTVSGAIDATTGGAGSLTTAGGFYAAKGIYGNTFVTVTTQLRAAYSAAATTLGSVVKKLQIFDAAGASLGYLPIYDAIT